MRPVLEEIDILEGDDETDKDSKDGEGQGSWKLMDDCRHQPFLKALSRSEARKGCV